METFLIITILCLLTFMLFSILATIKLSQETYNWSSIFYIISLIPALIILIIMNHHSFIFYIAILITISQIYITIVSIKYYFKTKNYNNNDNDNKDDN